MEIAAPLSEPQTLIEAIRYFADPDVTLRTMVELRWPNGICCPMCGRTDVRFIATRRLWECKEKHPRRQFSAKVGTIFEDSPIDLGKWFAAIWMVANCKNGISSYEMHRALGVTQKTAWFMDHRIRLAMQTGTFLKMGGEVEADETFMVGSLRTFTATSASGRSKALADLAKRQFSGSSSVPATKEPAASRPCMFPTFAAEHWLPKFGPQSRLAPLSTPTLSNRISVSPTPIRTK
jgi:hypothetical protein